MLIFTPPLQTMKIVVLAFAFLTMSAFPLHADTSLGETLERTLWENMKDRNWTAVENSISSQFQSVHPDGARNKAQEIALIKGLDIENYKLSNFKVTETKDTIIVTYLNSVREVINIERLSGQQSPRLSVWQNIDGKWVWISHANMNPFLDAKR